MRIIVSSLICFLFVTMVGCASWLMKVELSRAVGHEYQSVTSETQPE